MLLKLKYFHYLQLIIQNNEKNEDNQTNKAKQNNKNYQMITIHIFHQNEGDQEAESKH